MSDYFFSSKPKQIAESARIIAEKIFGDLIDQRLAVIGQNEVSIIISDEIKGHGIFENVSISIDDKSLKNSKDYEVSKMGEIENCLKNFDIIINGCTSDKFLIQRYNILNALKKENKNPFYLLIQISLEILTLI